MIDPEIKVKVLPQGLKAWHYGPAGWSVIDNPLAGGETDEVWPDTLKRAGYARQASIRLEAGKWASDYHLEVYDGKEFDHFVVCMGVKGNRYTVLVEGFQLLIGLLRELSPLVQFGAQTQDKEMDLQRRAEPTEGL